MVEIVFCFCLFFQVGVLARFLVCFCYLFVGVFFDSFLLGDGLFVFVDCCICFFWRGELFRVPSILPL